MIPPRWTLPLLLLAAAAGADCLVEVEPNPVARHAAGAPRSLAGAGCLTGHLEGGDVDITPWVVGPADAARRFRLSLQGAAGSLVSAEVVRVSLDAQQRPTKVVRIHRVEAGPLLGVGSGDWLWLPEGEYQLAVTGSGAALDYRLSLEPEPPAPAREVEPNDAIARPMSLALGARLAGDLEAGGVDHYRLTLPAAAASRRYAIRLFAPWSERPDPMALHLMDARGRPRAEGNRRGSSRVLDSLGLDPGDQVLRVRGRDPGPYLLETVDLGPRGPGDELEPNDGPDTACPARVQVEQVGELLPDDRDWWWLEVPALAAERRWRLRAEHGAGGTLRVQLVHQADAGAVTLLDRLEAALDVPSLQLAPGRYRVLVTQGTPGPYTWSLVRDRGRVQPGLEREPNDDPAQASPLSPAGTAQGRLVGRESDFVSFPVEEPVQRWTLQANGPGVARMTLLGPDGKSRKLVRGPRERGLRMEDLVLLPGVQRVELAGEDAPWWLRVMPTGPVPPGFETEPNDDPGDAEVLRLGETRRGSVASDDDVDSYHLGVEAAGGVRLVVTPPPHASLEVRFFWGADGGGRRLWFEREVTTPITLRRYLFPGDYLLQVRAADASPEDYAVTLEEAPEIPPPPPGEPDAPPPPPPPRSPLHLGLRGPPAPPLAYAAATQRLTLTLTASNPTGAPHTLTFSARSTHPLWRLEAPAPVTLAAGASRELAVPLAVLPGAWASWPVTLGVAASDEEGGWVDAATPLEAVEDGEAVAPVHHEPVPDALRGGMDVAALVHGATVRTQDARWRRQAEGLFDLQVGMGHGLELGDWQSHELVVDLAPGVHPVAGFLFHPLAKCGEAGRPARLAVDLAEDGVHFREVWQGTLDSSPREQAAVLPTPVPARAARLRLLATHGATPCLGEWKVVADPGAEAAPANLTSPQVGGHVVWAAPALRSSWSYDLLEADPRRSPTISGPCPKDADPTLVVGFWNHRAARLGRVEWVHHEEVNTPAVQVDTVAVAVSTESPLGPWRPLGEWDVRRARGPVAALELDPPVWARYLRLSLPGWTQRSYQAPAQLRVLEAPAGVGSVLGEWGTERRQGPFEAAGLAPEPELALAPEGSIRIDPGHGTQDAAQQLPAATQRRFHGKVRVGRRQDWVRLPVPAGMDTLHLTLRTAEAVLPELEAFGAGGPRIAPAEADRDALARRAAYRFAVAGPHVDLHLAEPRRSVVIAWDSSGSVHAYRQAIWRSVLRFSAGLDPEEEVANLLPFGSRQLLGSGWAETPKALRRILGDYDHSHTSSDAEGALALAAEKLAERDGRRVVMLITDAACGVGPPLWRELARARPQVFSLWVSSFGNAARPYLERSLMQGWASVNRGAFAALRSSRGIERELDRAAFLVRRPVAYLVEATFSKAAPPRPGSLEVVRGQAAGRAIRPALAMVLDASGSMEKPLAGRSRMQVAREALGELIRRDLPAGIDVSLRVFGHKEARSCRTDLELPLALLDREALVAKVESVTPQPLSKTPLGASLAAVAQDLAGATGPRMVVLVTDGEETCDGDPAAAIRALAGAGVATRVNIVGFAIEDAATKQSFAAWAELGGGAYFDAADPAGLSAAIARAVRLPYRVLDGAGAEVGRGEVGGAPLTLPPGEYVLETLGESMFRRKVQVPEGARLRIEL